MTRARKAAVKVFSRLSGQDCVLQPCVSFERLVGDDDDGLAGNSGFTEISLGCDRLRCFVCRACSGSQIHNNEPIVCCGLIDVACAAGLRRFGWLAGTAGWTKEVTPNRATIMNFMIDPVFTIIQ